MNEFSHQEQCVEGRGTRGVDIGIHCPALNKKTMSAE